MCTVRTDIIITDANMQRQRCRGLFTPDPVRG